MTFNLEFLAVLIFSNSSISLDICMSRLDKRMSRLDIRMSIPTMLVLFTKPFLAEENLTNFDQKDSRTE